MPLRDYYCPACAKVREAIVKSDGSDAPKTCECGTKLIEKPSAPASRFPGADTWRR